MYPNTNCSDCPDCPPAITPLPLPNLYGICGDTYDLSCVTYTGPDIECLGITSGMFIIEILNIFQLKLDDCDCCALVPQNCVLSAWSDWGECTCTYNLNSVGTCVQTRTRTVLIPQANGGTPCGPLSETRTTTLQPVCFTFGSNLCENAPNGTQVLAQAICYYNNKPYYQFTVCGTDHTIWFNTNNNLWYHTEELGVSTINDDTLNNNGNFYPISDTKTNNYFWTIATGKETMDIIQSTLTSCSDYLICFNLHLTQEGVAYNFINSVSAFGINPNNNNRPSYLYQINILGFTYNISINFDTLISKWVVTSDTESEFIGTLPDTGLYPIGTWTPNPLVSDSFMTTSTLGGTCVQPPDVNCVLGAWGAWGDCISGYRTRYRSIITPASGNGTCGPLSETEECAPVVCAFPTSVSATVSGTSVIVSFTPAVGASTYNVSYTTDGGSTYTTVNSTSSPITITTSLLCNTIYSGWIVTNCTNGLVSAQVPFTISTPECPPPPTLCGGSILNFITGEFTTPKTSLLKIDSTDAVVDSSQTVINVSPASYGYPQFWTSELTNDGLVLGGIPVNVGLNNLPNGFSGGLIKLKCLPSSSTIASEVNFDFIATTAPFYNIGQKGFEVNFGSSAIPVIRALKYDKINNRLYVGGHFDKYKGVNCSHNLICLNATTGDIIPITSFKIGIAGVYSSSASLSADSGVYDIQIDSNNKIVVAGMFDYYTNYPSGIYTQVRNIIRLNFDGTLDPTFAVSSTSFSVKQDNFSTVNLPSVVKSVYIDLNNDIYAVGGFHQYNNQNAFSIVKIKNNGTKALLSEFNSGTGFANIYHTGPGGYNRGWNKVLYSIERNVYAGGSGVTIEKIKSHMGKLLVTGNFTMYNDEYVNALVRINLNGTNDFTFARDTTLFNTTNVNSKSMSGMDIQVLLDDDNKILLGGSIANYLNTTGTNGYYILDKDGEVLNTTFINGLTPFIKTISSQLI